jgi:hypothetical protein
MYCKATGVSSATISELSGLPKRTVDRIYERALKHGFDPKQYQCMFLHGRLGHRVLLKVPDFALVMSALSASQSEGRQLGLNLEGHDISSSTVWRILKKAGVQEATPAESPV